MSKQGKAFASGGKSSQVDVALSHGEFAIPPSWVDAIGGKNGPENGHKKIDKWILALRKKYLKEGARLPPPKPD